MSVHVIYYEGGAKMMRPIQSRQEYMALRDSDQNRRADKMHMVQMNYSCLPKKNPAQLNPPQLNPPPTPPVEGGEYIPTVGYLKGATVASNSVGMDIDFDVNDPEYDRKMADAPKLIMDKKEELGLLMLERSATKGYHVVFRRHPELSQEENLKWASELLGVAYDKGAKDITRVFFTPADALLYLEDEIFERERLAPTPCPSPRGDEGSGNLAGTAGIGGDVLTVGTLTSVAQKGEALTVGPLTSVAQKGDALTVGPLTSEVPKGDALTAKPCNLLAFDLCVKSAGLRLEDLDIEGEHNWHTNLMAVLSVGLPKLMSREQLMAVVNKKLPNYARTDDCKALIDYFYEKYTADKGFMSPTLRSINAEAQRMAAAAEAQALSEKEQNEKDMAELTNGWTMKEAPKKVPRLLELLVGNYDPRYREMLLLAALPVLSAHASHYRAVYLNGRTIGPMQYVSIIGGSGSGKGNCTSLFQDMVQHTLQENDDREWLKVKENAELRDKMANAKERPPKYHPRLRLFETTSKSSILELQKNVGKNGMLLGQFSEVDGFSGSTRAAYSDITVLLRKAWDLDIHRQFYLSDTSCNTYAQMSISLLMAGTVKAMLERMFSDDNCESGLMQRFIPVIVPKTKRTFRPPMQNYLSTEEKDERDELMMKLYQKDLSLGDNTLTLETPLTNRMIGEWFDELEERYSDGDLTEAEADLSRRCGEFMLRAAIPLIALYGHETKEILDFCRWVGDVALSNMSRLFGYRVQKDISTSNELMAKHLDARVTTEPLLNSLPSVFTAKEFKEARIKAGQSPEANMLLTRYCKSGKLERMGRGVYRKKGSTEA